MAKNVWMTSIGPSKEEAGMVSSRLLAYGLKVKGHFWEDDLEKMAWAAAREELVDPSVALWLILSTRESLNVPSIRYGLSLLAVAVRARRGHSFPVALLLPDGGKDSLDSLPTLFKGFDLYSLADPGLAAKLVAKVHAPSGEIQAEYRLDVYGSAQVGQWFEVGPQTASWAGALFGVSGAEIAFHGVGQKGSLPSRSVLNYPSKGMKLALGDKEYLAWSVQNELDAQSSYFVKVTGNPDSILFGPYSSTEQADVFVVTLK